MCIWIDITVDQVPLNCRSKQRTGFHVLLPGICCVGWICLRHDTKLGYRRFRVPYLAWNSNSMENMHCCKSMTDHQIATNFCTCHDSIAVMSCAKFRGNHFVRNGRTAKQNFHKIWIAMEKLQVKWSSEIPCLAASLLGVIPCNPTSR